MSKDMGLEWTLSHAQSSPVRKQIGYLEFSPPQKEISISKETLHNVFDHVKTNMQKWNIIPPTIMEVMLAHLSIDNIIPSDHGHYQTSTYEGQDQITMDTDLGLQDALRQTFDYFDITLTSDQIENLSLEFNLAHELGHGLRTVIARDETKKRLQHSGILDTKEIEAQFQSSFSLIDSVFLTQNPMEEFNAQKDNPKLVFASDERIAQSVTYLYFDNALQREGLSEAQSREIIQTMMVGTREAYSEDFSMVKHVFEEDAQSAHGTDDGFREATNNCGYAFPVNKEQIDKFLKTFYLA